MNSIYMIHDSIFGDIVTGPSKGRDGIHTGKILAQLTIFIHQQNQQILVFIDEARKNVKQVNDKIQS